MIKRCFTTAEYSVDGDLSLGPAFCEPFDLSGGTVHFTKSRVNGKYPEDTEAYLTCLSGYRSSGVDTTTFLHPFGRWKDQDKLLTCTGEEVDRLFNFL